MLGAELVLEGLGKDVAALSRIVVLVQNRQGYLNLSELLARAWTQNVVKAQAVVKLAWLQELNGLLKRLCRMHYPADQSHTLSGRAWLAYLDNRCPAAGLTRWMILVEGAYRPQCKLDDKAIAGLYQSVETWIRKHV